MSATGCTCGHVIDNHRFRWDQATGAARHGACIIPGCPCSQWTPTDPTWPAHQWSGKDAAQSLATENARLRDALDHMVETLSEQTPLIRRQTQTIAALRETLNRIQIMHGIQPTPGCPRCITPDPELCTELLPLPAGLHTHCPQPAAHNNRGHGDLSLAWT